MIVLWNQYAVEHIAKHGVAPADAEHVLRHAAPPFPRAMRDEKYLVWGRARSGLLMQVIFVYQEDEGVDYESLTVADRIAYEAG